MEAELPVEPVDSRLLLLCWPARARSELAVVCLEVTDCRWSDGLSDWKLFRSSCSSSSSSTIIACGFVEDVDRVVGLFGLVIELDDAVDC